jgi:hypothetical protein
MRNRPTLFSLGLQRCHQRLERGASQPFDGRGLRSSSPISLRVDALPTVIALAGTKPPYPTLFVALVSRLTLLWRAFGSGRE